MGPLVQSEKDALIGQLRIDRSDPPPQGSRLRAVFVWALVVATALLTMGAIARSFIADDPSAHAETMGDPVQTPPVSTGATTPPVLAQPSLLDASGYVVARRRATVSAKVTGKVTEVSIEEGKRVEEGDVIARLDDSTYRAALEQARAHLAQAEAQRFATETALHDAQPIYERNRKQLSQGFISAQAFDTATATYNAARTALTVAHRGVDAARASLTVAQRNLDDTVVRAPFSGIVTEKAAQPGEIVSPMSAGGGFTRTGIGTIVDMDSLEVEVDVGETYIDRVRAKQRVSVKLNAYADWQIPGEVIATIPTADRAKATVRVRIALLEKDVRVIPEMGARVSFLGEDPLAASIASRHVVPMAAVKSPTVSDAPFAAADGPSTIESSAPGLMRDL